MNRRLALALGAVLLIFIIAIIALLSTGEQGESTHAREGPFIVCLDPGHGGSDVGAQDETQTRNEKDDNLALALAVRDALLAMEAPPEVVMTRDDDTALTLMERCEFANEADVSIYVSLHRNTGGGQGVEVWISSAQDREEKALGSAIMTALEGTEISRSRGVRSGTAGSPINDYVVIRETTMPACIVEVGFLDSETDNALFDKNLDAYAAAIAAGIMAAE